VSRELAEREIFDLRRKAELFLRAGDIQQYSCILIVIAQIQEANNVTVGVERKRENDRTAA
jgi:hypothetical protein